MRGEESWVGMVQEVGKEEGVTGETGRGAMGLEVCSAGMEMEKGLMGKGVAEMEAEGGLG